MSLLGLCLQLHCWVFIDRVHATISLAALAEATWTVLKSPCYYITRKLKNLFFCSCTPHVATQGCSENPICWENWLLQEVLWFVLLSCPVTYLWAWGDCSDSHMSLVVICLVCMITGKFGWILPAEVHLKTLFCFLCSKLSEALVYHLATCNSWNKWEQTWQDNFWSQLLFTLHTVRKIEIQVEIVNVKWLPAAIFWPLLSAP